MRLSYRNYLLGVLTVILGFSYADRLMFGVLQEAIRTDLQLTDTQLGLLSGVAFTIFFALLGMPIARWADRGNRVAIVSLTTAVWGISVALCSVAGSFWHLLLIRIGIAAGEAGCQPPAHSLIPEYFSRAERPRAVGRYMLGASLGTMVGYVAAGWLNELYGWRMTFVIVGLPGIAFAVLTALTLKEPRRQVEAFSRATAKPAEIAPSLKEVVIILARNATFRNLLLAFLVWYFCGWGLLQWLPTFFIRSYGMATGELGTWLAVLWGGGGLIGVLFGGEWASRFAAGNERLQLATAGMVFAACTLIYTLSLLTSNPHLGLILTGVAALVGAVANGPVFATIQTLVVPRMRATAGALMTLLPSFVGAGFGPLAVGAISDGLQGWAGAQSLRYALFLMCPGFMWAGWHLWRASRTVTHDVASLPKETMPIANVIAPPV